ncbi:MAG: phosphoribosylanthranilate isomerase [Candidatus Acidiferrum sp.]|jgi:phosphoribosylanthranilate isomerase
MVLVKICGITNYPDAQAAVEAGANSLGLNFYPRSPRFIAKADAAKIRIRLPGNVESVGVFVNASAGDVAALYRDVRFAAAQLHGDETPEVVKELSRLLKVVKAFRVGANFPLEKLAEYPEAAAFLLDAAQAGQFGGTGHTTDWDLARKAAAAHRIILAGGLTIENVAAAIQFVRPHAVDVASGVESKPGRKDHGKLREFIQEVRRAGSQLDAAAAQNA